MDATNTEVKVNPNELTTSTRKRPNKSKILKQGKLRGYLTDNEEIMLKTLTIKNLLQRLNNRAFEGFLKTGDCKKIEGLMTQFETDVDNIIKEKYALKETKSIEC